MNELLKRMEDRRAALIKQSNESKDIAELKSINQQLLTLNEDIEALRSVKAENPNEDMDERTAAIRAHMRKEEMQNESRGTDPPKYIPGKGFVPAEERGNPNLNSELEKREQAGQDLRKNISVKSPLSTFGELRAVTVTPAQGDAATIVVPSNFSANINPDFPSVSSLANAVSYLSLNGGEKFRQPYLTGFDLGGYTGEGEDYHDATTHFDYVDINKTKITAFTELTEEVFKLPAAPYADMVFQNIRNSMRKLLTKEILVGSGGNNQLVGIFSSAATAISPDTDYAISQITDTTLDEIVFNYGGEEEVEEPAVLLLSKLDLLAFSKVRTATKQKYYDIHINGNSGTINSIPFILNSACKSLVANDTATGDYCMAYGLLSSYLLVEFSPLEVKKSDDYKFRQGITAFRGSCFFGGNVTRKNGFLRIVKA